MKSYRVISCCYTQDGLKLETLLNQGWQIERSETAGSFAIFILYKEV